MSGTAKRTVFAAILILGSLGASTALAACRDNMLAGGLKTVPPVHRIPPDVEGTVILIAEDPLIESHDPVHIARAKEKRVPHDLRESMVRAFGLAGFKVVSDPGEPHDLVARLALAVSEQAGELRQVYRCGLRGADGTEVAQIDWTWPEGTYVEMVEVLDFATHNVATDVATSRRVVAYLRSGVRSVRPKLPIDAAPATVDVNAGPVHAADAAP